jgi:predicted HicB family RNase H-like nuclease
MTLEKWKLKGIKDPKLEKKSNLTITIDPYLRRRLEARAKKQHRSLSNLISILLHDALDREGENENRS